MTPNSSTVWNCDSSARPEKFCSTNSSCYYYAKINQDRKLEDETFGCTDSSHPCINENINNLIRKCCSKENYCNRILREEASLDVRKNTYFKGSLPNHWPYVFIMILCFFITVAVIGIIRYLYLRRRASIEEDSKNPIFGRDVEMQPQLNQRTAAMDLQLKENIGEGSFGKVFLANYKGENVAVKIFETNHLRSFLMEKKVYEFGSMKNDYVLKCIFSDTKDDRFVLVTEYCACGSLRSMLSRETIDVVLCISMAHDIANGLAYLHNEIVVSEFNSGKPAIAHRDIKSTNIFLRSNFKCVIGDFGYSLLNWHFKSTNDFEPKNKNTSLELFNSPDSSEILVGTMRYLAPEVLQSTINAGDFEAFKQSDIYSFALVLWEIGCRTVVNGRVSAYTLPYFEYCELPSPTVEQMIQMTSFRRPSIPSYWDDSNRMVAFRKIIEECWSRTPERRLTSRRVQFQLKSLFSLFDGYHSS